MSEISFFIQDNRLHPAKFPYDEPIRGGKVSENFTLGEWLDSMRFINEEERKAYYQFDSGLAIPFNNNLPEVAQTVRDFTGKAVYLGSSFRSKRWEVSKGRSGDGDHPKGNAVDLNGEDVYSLLHQAVREKNELYQALKALGVNAFGFYSWGVHLGIRTPKQSGEDYLWYNNEEVKKKEGFDKIMYLVYFVLIYLFHKPLLKMLKKIFKF